VGVVTWNTADLTVGALRRLLDSDQGCDLRVLVHDNASHDGTAEAIAQYVPEAEVEVGPENVGFARGVNQLLARSKAPWFVALNSDAWPEPGALGRMVEAAQREPKVAAVAPLLLRPDGEVEHSTHRFPSLTVASIDALGARKWLPRNLSDSLCLEGAWRHDRPRSVDWAVGAAILIRREALEEIGPFDERFFMYVEDLEWCWRAHRCGWDVRFEPSAVVRHVGNVSGSSRFGTRRAALEAANLLTFLSDTHGPRWVGTYRALTAFAAATRMVGTRLVGRQGESARWRRQVVANLGWSELPQTSACAGRRSEDGSGSSTSGDTRGERPGDTSGERPGEPRVSVAVSSYRRARLLPRLVAGLEAQTLTPEQFEVIVVDNASPDDTSAVLEELASRSALQLRPLRAPVQRGPAAGRNLAWRAARAPVVAFTDDDCVPTPRWLESGLSALDQARVVVGRTAPPADQLHKAEGAFARVLSVDEVRFFETCNIFYHREDLVAAGGFEEGYRNPGGEDTDLALRVLRDDSEAVFAPEALVHHDVRPGNLRAALREATRWTDVPLVVRRHPRARRRLLHRWVFWKPSHPPAICAAIGLLLALRFRPGLVLVLPWLRYRLSTEPAAPGGVLRVIALPGALALDLLEVGVMIRGSVRHRTVVL